MAMRPMLDGAFAAQFVAIDAEYMDVSNTHGHRPATEEPRIESFAAKPAIQPVHCDVINAAFAPNAKEVGWARQVISALSQLGASEVATLDDKMIDKPH